MLKSIVLAAGLTLVGLTAAAAAPFGAQGTATGTESMVEKVQAWRYHKACSWNGKGWFVTERGRLVVCRPHSPGRGWVWHSEGGRHGWYHPKHKNWHHKW